MTLDYSEDEVFRVHMKNYIEMILKDFPYNLGEKKVKCPWNQNLCKMSNEGEPLNWKNAETFHTFVAKGLSLARSGRPDIMPCIAFLTTRVKNPTEEDWSKLILLLQFLKNKKDDVLRLKMNDNCIVKWYLDPSFGVCADMKSHTGAIMTLGEGVAQVVSTIQKTNMRSSREAELISFDDIETKVFWTKLFLKEQGYEVAENIVYRDNQAAMKVEVNGKLSSGKRT